MAAGSRLWTVEDKASCDWKPVLGILSMTRLCANDNDNYYDIDDEEDKYCMAMILYLP